MTRRILVVLAAAAGTLFVAPSAQAFTTLPVWKCRASPTYASVNGLNRVEPVTANGNINTASGVDPDHQQCAPAEAGAGNTATQIGIPQDLIGASSASGVTTITPELGRAIDQKVTAAAKVENLQVQLPAGSPSLLGVQAATSSVTGSCSAGKLTPNLNGTSQVATLTVLGAPVPLDGLVGALTTALQPLGFLVDVKINERVSSTTANAESLTIRALHVKIIRGNGTPVVDLVVAESKVAANGPVCDPDKQNDGGGNDDGICPKGSELVPSTNLCVIKGSTSGSSLGDIIVGAPFQGPSGGTVVPIDIARKKYGRSPCLGFSGNPKFAIIGTNKSDRITGSNIADRIIGLGGNDKLDGGRGNDCIEGRTGGDTMSGALGNDKLYGSVGKDHLNGGPGTDYLSAGAGNDTVNASFGRDRVLGGTGVDFINIATAGPAASADCGSGADKIRLNRNETRKVRNCETIYIFKDK
jgi:Ca2+-binding RTX toxin-like protein